MPSSRFSRLSLWLGLVLLLSGCATMKPQDYAGREPELRLENYFQGRTEAWGLFQDRFGMVRRQFTVDILGLWNGEELLLIEDFLYDDGERDRRIWRIAPVGDHGYQGQAEDVVGIAEGEAHGNALNWRYDLDLKVGDKTWRVHFDDWMFLQPGGVLINRAEVRKLGLTVGEVTIVFRKKQSLRERRTPPLQTAAVTASPLVR